MLELRFVHPESERLIERGEILPDYRVFKLERSFLGRKTTEQLLIKRQPEPGLNGQLIKNAMVLRSQSGEPEIDFRMLPEASAAFAKTTRENTGRRLAVLLDGKLYSAPRINAPIENGYCRITGHFTQREAFLLAVAMDCPLPCPVVVVDSRAF
jgi:preprotein translocase subunit SecD